MLELALRGLVSGLIFGLIFSAIVFAGYVSLLKSAFGDVSSKDYPSGLGAGYNTFLSRRGLAGWLVVRFNLGLFNLYGLAGYTSLTSEIRDPNPFSLRDALNKGFLIDSSTTTSLSFILSHEHPATTLPPDVVLKEWYGDCDDYAFFVASMFRKSYVVFVFVDCGDGSLGFHAFPVVVWRGDYYVIDYVGNVFLSAKSLTGALDRYRFGTDCKVYVDAVYRVDG